MAKTTGDQNIPSELLDAYRATLGEQRPDKTVEKRYPFHLPHMQSGGSGVKAAQVYQRYRFGYAKTKFAGIDWPERQRWYAAMPEWGSLLWYYNFFIMSGLSGGLGTLHGGGGMIKKIQNRIISVPNGGTTITHDTVIDASKAVVMIWGASYKYSQDQVGDYPFAWAWPVYPVWGTLNNTNVSLTWSMPIQATAKVAIQVIEYI